ncbi:hypothetical protein H2198_002174 [Neophaeococcomyces mojaviensis]|uniref:Uncharacterized protein n=1 Tax=Neophaeococcomyces mojaviensis TaxID=3383035 RepID=A0ACC3AF15_9EURO|nr:hypothetical protein H2198_002174 [Knufia sp. JES_112]
MLSKNAFDPIGFKNQLCCLTLAPAFNSAAIYLVLKHPTRVFRPEFCRLRFKHCTWIFIVADTYALVLQGAGGGVASKAGLNDSLMKVGEGLTMAGISWQVVTLAFFAFATADCVVQRY